MILSAGAFAASANFRNPSAGLFGPSDNPFNQSAGAFGQSSSSFGQSAGSFNVSAESSGASCWSNIHTSKPFGLSAGSFGPSSHPFGSSSNPFGSSDRTFGASSSSFGLSANSFGVAAGAFGLSAGAFGTAESLHFLTFPSFFEDLTAFRQLLDLPGQPFSLFFQLGVFNFKLLRPFCRQFIQNARLPLRQLAKLVIRAFAQRLQRCRAHRDFPLQRLTIILLLLVKRPDW